MFAGVTFLAIKKQFKKISQSASRPIVSSECKMLKIATAELKRQNIETLKLALVSAPNLQIH